MSRLLHIAGTGGVVLVPSGFVVLNLLLLAVIPEPVQGLKFRV